MSSAPAAHAAPAKFGEVVESSIERLIGQCHVLYGAPPLGALVRAGEDIFAIVSGVSAAALDPGRRVIARGAGFASEADVYAEHPQLERLLRTDVTLTVVGHREGERLFRRLPPAPPRVHAFLYACSPEETAAFMHPADWTAVLLSGALPAADDVIAAALRQAAPCFPDPRAFLMSAGRAVAAQLPADAARLAAIMRRLPLDETE